MTEGPLFLYGTLRHDPVFALIAGEGAGTATPARLSDHRVARAADGLPLLIPAPGQVAEGEVWQGLDAGRARRLDMYEEPFGYERRPVTVQTDEGPIEAEAYFPPHDVPPGVDDWALGPWAAQYGAAAILCAQEMALHEPPLPPEELVRQWPRMRARAEARARAAASSAPATRRHAPRPGDLTATLDGTLQGGFFKFAGLRLQHRRFDGAQSEVLPREVFWGFDASLILPYDPAHDVVLLIEQARTGPAWRHDANPWTLEPVAGLIDAGETPEQAARREGEEEAGLSFSAVESMFAAYPSPGASTDFFHCFVGIADIPEETARHGGLASEHEDLRLHRISFDDAMALVTSGEITALPLITMLYWLGANRARLRR